MRSAMLSKLGMRDVGAAYEAAEGWVEVHRGVLHRKSRLRRKDGRSDRWRPTERQLQIIRNRLDGMGARQNADALGVKRGTIHATIDQMKRRARVKTFDELVAKFAEWGLVEAPPPPEDQPANPPVRLGPLRFRVWRMHCEGKSNSEIAEAVGIKYTAVVQHLSVARKKLRAWLETERGHGREHGAKDEDLMSVPVAGREAR
jgi:DNA-binding CsgD family transcriptional regulator